MANVDFTNPAWDIVEEIDNIDVIASKVSWNDLLRTHTSHVSDSATDQGVSLAGDFTHKFECQFSDITNSPHAVFWGAFENAKDFYSSIIDDDDSLSFYHSEDDFTAAIFEGGDKADDDKALALISGTTYFVTIDYVVATKTLTADIHTGAHHPGGVHVDLLTATGSAGVTVNYIMALASYDSGTAGHNADGFTQNLDIGAAAGVVVTPYYYRSGISSLLLLPFLWVNQKPNDRRSFLKNTLGAVFGCKR